MKRIDDYKVHLGMDKGERKMKMQGVMSKDCKLDLTKHFSKPDYQAERMAEEKKQHQRMLEKESRTTLGAVKRLIQKVSSLSVEQ